MNKRILITIKNKICKSFKGNNNNKAKEKKVYNITEKTGSLTVKKSTLTSSMEE